MALFQFGRFGSRSGLVLDVGIVAVLGALTLYKVWVFGDVAGPVWLLVVLPLFLDLSLLWRRRHPLVVIALISIGAATQAFVSGAAAEGLFVAGPFFVGLYSVAAYSPRRPALLGLGAGIAGLVALSVEDHTWSAPDAAYSAAFWYLTFVTVWVSGAFVRSHREASRHALRAADIEREALAAVSEERGRMARELHDIVSHTLSVVVVQAAGARAVADSRPEAALPTLEKIENSGREALQEMRRLLGVLRDEDQATTLEPQPGVAELDQLVESIRSAGVPVELQIQDEARHLPPSVDLCVYRIVQESLTNVLKHAGPARAQVRLGCDANTVTVEVLDDGNGCRVATPGRHGHALTGMRERAALFGGRLDAGERPEGGFSVLATLALQSE